MFGNCFHNWAKDTPPPNHQGPGEPWEAFLLFVHQCFEGLKGPCYGPLTSLKSCKNIGPGENLGRGHKNEIILGYPLCRPKK